MGYSLYFCQLCFQMCSDVPVEVVRIWRSLVDFSQYPGDILMLCLKGMLQLFLIDRRQLHGVERHVHVVLGDQGGALLGSQLCLEAVAVVEVAVVGRRNVLEALDALVRLRLCFPVRFIRCSRFQRSAHSSPRRM